MHSARHRTHAVIAGLPHAVQNRGTATARKAHKLRQAYLGMGNVVLEMQAEVDPIPAAAVLILVGLT